MRLDLFLKTSRLVKRRTVAKEMCDAGRVLVNGRDASPSREIRPGDRIVIRYAARHLDIQVTFLPERRGAFAPEEIYRILSVTPVQRSADPS